MTRSITRMTINDAEHYSEEQKQQIIASYPEHEREARAMGVPTLGSGKVFPVSEASIKCDPFSIPKHWVRIVGIDFGYDHPFAATCNAWDKDSDTWYVTAAYRQSRATPVIHAAAVKPWGDWIPVAWPHDGFQHDKGSGLGLAAQYKAQGLNLLDEHSTYEDGGNGVEAGLNETLDLMQTGRFKVFSNLSEWFDEFRMYHRKEGKVVKVRDDLMSATRYAIMMKREAVSEPVKRRAVPSNASPWAA